MDIEHIVFRFEEAGYRQESVLIGNRGSKATKVLLKPSPSLGEDFMLDYLTGDGKFVNFVICHPNGNYSALVNIYGDTVMGTYIDPKMNSASGLFLFGESIRMFPEYVPGLEVAFLRAGLSAHDIAIAISG